MMLPVESGNGQVWRRDQYLCDAQYEVSEPFQHNEFMDVQRITLTIDDADCEPLLRSYDLTLVMADGKRHQIPHPLRLTARGVLEVYLESKP